MGKKKDKKKGKGAEKTAAKTEKKLASKQKKDLAAVGEDDIEKILADIEKEEKAREKVVEIRVDPPSRRGNFSFIAHPDKDELILFGGEYFNGQKTIVYNDMFFYNIPRNEWTLIKAPRGPTPVCGHQMVSTSANKGQLWLFGGEYTSPTQSQFYHYRDLWVYHLADKKWEKIQAAGGPSARSGHRMVHSKKRLILFGGFHDNLKDYKYFNDVYIFNLEDYKWSKVEPSGNPPAPRSGCNMIALADGRVAIFGGYSRTRLKKDVDKGQIHNDLFILAPDKHDTTGTKWKWVSHKRNLDIPPRCSMPVTVAPNSRAYCFGGVFDIEENDENLAGEFFNDLYSIDLEKLSFSPITLRTKIERKKQIENEDKMDTEPIQPTPAAIVSDDGIFTCKVGSSVAPTSSTASKIDLSKNKDQFWPSARMNCGMAVKNGLLYLFGGILEDGDKQITLCDFYSLNLHKQDEWRIICSDDIAKQEWYDSESEGDDDSSESDDSNSGDDSVNSENEESNSHMDVSE